MNIVHRDLKPENILLESPCPRISDKPLIKIIDFGTSTMLREGKNLKKKIGTAYYVAPEVLSKCYNEKCDIWSIGIILYVLLSGRPPFTGSNDKEILEKIKRGDRPDFTGEVWAHANPDSIDLIERMLVLDYDLRPSAMECLEHPWIA
jgi:calcium-dependent protein kinase